VARRKRNRFTVVVADPDRTARALVAQPTAASGGNTRKPKVTRVNTKHTSFKTSTQHVIQGSTRRAREAEIKEIKTRAERSRSEADRQSARNRIKAKRATLNATTTVTTKKVTVGTSSRKKSGLLNKVVAGSRRTFRRDRKGRFA
jgi:hypothetical protein